MCWWHRRRPAVVVAAVGLERCGFPTENGTPCRNTKACSWHPPEVQAALLRRRDEWDYAARRKRLAPQAAQLAGFLWS